MKTAEGGGGQSKSGVRRKGKPKVKERKREKSHTGERESVLTPSVFQT